MKPDLDKRQIETREIRANVLPQHRKALGILAIKNDISRADLAGQLLEDYLKGKLVYKK